MASFVTIDPSDVDAESIWDVPIVNQMNENALANREDITTLQSLGLVKSTFRVLNEYAGVVIHSVGAVVYVNAPLSEALDTKTMTPSSVADAAIVTSQKIDLSGFQFGDKLFILIRGQCESSSMNLKITTADAANYIQSVNRTAGTGFQPYFCEFDIIISNETNLDLCDLAVNIDPSGSTRGLTIESILIDLNVG